MLQPARGAAARVNAVSLQCRAALRCSAAQAQRLLLLADCSLGLGPCYRAETYCSPPDRLLLVHLQCRAVRCCSAAQTQRSLVLTDGRLKWGLRCYAKTKRCLSHIVRGHLLHVCSAGRNAAAVLLRHSAPLF